MLIEAATNQASQLLERLTDGLDIADHLFVSAEARYKSVANWLARDESRVADWDCHIYPQGSFLLGTVVKPISDEDQYDLDLVCVVKGNKSEWSQASLKAAIGEEIKSYAISQGMNAPALEGRRCWTLHYAERAQFHLDILPALPQDLETKLELRSLQVDPSHAELAIAITDRTTHNYTVLDPDWPQSNPEGFAEWFKVRGRPAVLKFGEAEIAQVPYSRQRTVLQRMVQVLKRHRDLMFAGSEAGLAPISIIITTLAARAYQGEEDLLEAVQTVSGQLVAQLDFADGIWLVRNPVNPAENFADKWSDHPERRDAFFAWADRLQRDFAELAVEPDVRIFSERLRPVLGEQAVDRALRTFAEPAGRVVYGAPAPARAAAVDRFDVPHRERPQWPVRQTYDVHVTGQQRPAGGGAWAAFDNGQPLAKGLQLRFRASSACRDIDQTYWQVVNTGEEAADHGQLRGQIVASATAGVGGLTVARGAGRQTEDCDERTAYTGRHWIECFIVKDGVCVGRSEPFVVNIT